MYDQRFSRFFITVLDLFHDDGFFLLCQGRGKSGGGIDIVYAVGQKDKSDFKKDISDKLHMVHLMMSELMIA